MELKERVNLSEIIGSDIKLTKKGKEYWGCCPFHPEKTPSFSVNDEKGFYYCFGCGAKGDVYSYLEEKHKYSFGLWKQSCYTIPRNNFVVLVNLGIFLEIVS